MDVVVFKQFEKVTILILIDGFLQLEENELKEAWETSHNPYFNRWFSAIVHYYQKFQK